MRKLILVITQFGYISMDLQENLRMIIRKGRSIHWVRMIISR